MLGLMPQADGGSRLLFAGVDWLKSAVWMSLGTDRRAENDDVLPGGDGDKRGWWGDSFRSRRIGSRLWLLERQKITADTLLRAEEYAAEALAWLTERKIAATVRVRAERHTLTCAMLYIEIEKDGGEIRRFDYLWSVNHGV